MTRYGKSHCSAPDSHSRGNSSCDKMRFRKRKNILHRIQSKKFLNVAEVVYGFLGNMAIIDAERRFDYKRCEVGSAGLERDGLMHKQPQKSRLYKKRIRHDYSGTALHTGHKYKKRLQRIINVKNASKPLAIDTQISPRNKEATVPKSLSWISHMITRLNKPPFFIQVTNDYIKASLGAALSNFQSARGKDDESRSQRRKLRRGPENCNSLDRKSLRRGISPWFTSNRRRRSGESEAVVTKKTGKIDKDNRDKASSLETSTGSSNRSASCIERNKRSRRSKSPLKRKNMKSRLKNMP
ncbi:uncharacterized protein LOC112494063 [Cephus cinctus]|uniref:Uncharacterized protein LOC112494063 n=1 Tax=Cephus cinctus TaxID=211228 RepID=A0AAJ7VZG0_CEPCN|nr:uncharacterized protein LOC112494063 [Cephus cinctus]